MLYRHMGALFFEETSLQVSSIVLATAIIILPIYSFKVVKMRFMNPNYFPTDKLWKYLIFFKSLLNKLNKIKHMGFWGFGVLGFCLELMGG